MIGGVCKVVGGSTNPTERRTVSSGAAQARRVFRFLRFYMNYSGVTKYSQSLIVHIKKTSDCLDDGNI